MAQAWRLGHASVTGEETRYTRKRWISFTRAGTAAFDPAPEAGRHRAIGPKRCFTQLDPLMFASAQRPDMRQRTI